MNTVLRKSIGMLLCTCFCVVGWSFFAASVAQRQSSGEQELIRLHVLANSDSPIDQSLKRTVRNAVIRYLEPKTEGIKDREQVKKIILENELEIQRVATETLLAQGVYNSVNVEYGIFDFPLKSYGNVVVPAGRYEALRVLIGEAKGANWWCVLFPPLCFVDESKVVQTTDDSETKELMEDTQGRIAYKFKILEFFKDN